MPKGIALLCRSQLLDLENADVSHTLVTSASPGSVQAEAGAIFHTCTLATLTEAAHCCRIAHLRHLVTPFAARAGIPQAVKQSAYLLHFQR